MNLFNQLTSKSEQTHEDNEVSYGEKEQYELIIRKLVTKIEGLTKQVTHLKKSSQHHSALSAVYKSKFEEANRKNLILYSKVMKTSGLIQKFDEEQEQNSRKQHEDLEQLYSENQNLRKLLNIGKEFEDQEKDSLLKDQESKIEEPKKTESANKNDYSDLYGDSENSNPFNTGNTFKLNQPKLKINSEEMINKDIKREIKKKHRKLKRSRATSFHFGSETPNIEDNNFEGFEFSMANESKTPLIPKNSFKSFSFKTTAKYEDLSGDKKDAE